MVSASESQGEREGRGLLPGSFQKRKKRQRCAKRAGFQDAKCPFPCPEWTRGFSFERVGLAMSGQTMSLGVVIVSLDT
jgi:hypothetical protein